MTTQIEISTATDATVTLYKELGLLTDCKSLVIVRENGQFEVWGHFQNANGRKNARVASFDNAEDAVDFRRKAM